MELKNALIVVNNIEKSKAFYKDLFGLDVIADFDGRISSSGKDCSKRTSKPL